MKHDTWAGVRVINARKCEYVFGWITWFVYVVGGPVRLADALPVCGCLLACADFGRDKRDPGIPDTAFRPLCRPWPPGACREAGGAEPLGMLHACVHNAQLEHSHCGGGKLVVRRQVMFVESICNDDEKIIRSIMVSKSRQSRPCLHTHAHANAFAHTHTRTHSRTHSLARARVQMHAHPTHAHALIALAHSPSAEHAVPPARLQGKAGRSIHRQLQGLWHWPVCVRRWICRACVCLSACSRDVRQLSCTIGSSSSSSSCRPLLTTQPLAAHNTGKGRVLPQHLPANGPRGRRGPVLCAHGGCGPQPLLQQRHRLSRDAHHAVRVCVSLSLSQRL